MMGIKESNNELGFTKRFDRNFFNSSNEFMWIGEGSFGGKASGLGFIKKIIDDEIGKSKFPEINICIPRMVVVRTDIFDKFMEHNNLYEVALSEHSDVFIIDAFQKAELPVEVLGDLWSLTLNVSVPLAVRSSSMLEDDKYEPFAGIYATKMISNNQSDNETRFQKLVEAIKFVYASVFFKESKDYFGATKHSVEDEKMAVIIQEIVGQKHNERFYPNLSGVARSYNYYSLGKLKPEQGVVNLALGLGKTIVDGDIVWSYSPVYPKSVPPFADPSDMLKNTQLRFWSVNMSPFIHHDPTKEIEYLIESELSDADYDNTLKLIASTYDTVSEKILMGVGNKGPRIINFAPLLNLNEYKFNDLIQSILKVCEEAVGDPVEIEFAVNFGKEKASFGFLQIRPMVVSSEIVEVDEDEMIGENVLLSSDKALGNGVIDNISDIVFVIPKKFDKKNTQQIAEELDRINRKLLEQNIPCLLIGFGRWGSSDPWLGIPVEWGQISGAKVIVESTLPGINVDLSQGSHFFHNMTGFKVKYFSINFDGKFKIDWDWLNNQKIVDETEFVKHIKLDRNLKIKVDGRKACGVITKC